MKLIIRRNQAEQKGLLGGHKGISFRLDAWAELTDAERALLARYSGVEDTILTYVDIPQGKVPRTAVSVASLTAGQALTTPDVTVLLAAEEEIKEGCKRFRDLLDVMNSFGGEVAYEFETSGPAT